jgi:hypothetical protein
MLDSIENEFTAEYEFKLKVRIGDPDGSGPNNTRKAVLKYLLLAIQGYGDIHTNDWAWHLQEAELE